ncbi:hypothetical protein WDU94_010505 [Cyamophila willieti]
MYCDAGFFRPNSGWVRLILSTHTKNKFSSIQNECQSPVYLFLILFNVLIFPNLKNCGATPTTKGNADMFKKRQSPIPGPDPVNNGKLRGQATISHKKKKTKITDGIILTDDVKDDDVIF